MGRLEVGGGELVLIVVEESLEIYDLRKMRAEGGNREIEKYAPYVDDLIPTF